MIAGKKTAYVVNQVTHRTRWPSDEQGFKKVIAGKKTVYVVNQSLIERAAQAMSKESTK